MGKNDNVLKNIDKIEDLTILIRQLSGEEKIDVLMEEFLKGGDGFWNAASKFSDFLKSGLKLGDIIVHNGQPYYLEKVNLDGTINTMLFSVPSISNLDYMRKGFFDEINEIKFTIISSGPKIKINECEKIDEAFIVEIEDENMASILDRIQSRIFFSQETMLKSNMKIIRVKKVPLKVTNPCESTSREFHLKMTDFVK